MLPLILYSLFDNALGICQNSRINFWATTNKIIRNVFISYRPTWYCFYFERAKEKILTRQSNVTYENCKQTIGYLSKKSEIVLRVTLISFFLEKHKCT